MHLIDYGHMRDGVLYHGSISDLDGVPRSTWSYEKEGKKVTHDQPIDDATFRSLCHGVATLDVFKRCRVRDPNREVDPVADHVITFSLDKEGQVKRAYFAVPAGESDPEFLRWLQALNIPAGSLKKPAQDEAGSSAPASFARKWAPARDKVYPAFFGKKCKVSRDSSAQGPPIDIYIFEPGGQTGQERDFYTLVTGGLSDFPMKVPEGVQFRRAELVLYVDEPAEQHLHVLRWLARLPLVQEGTWYGPGTDMPNGRPPQPIFDGSELDCFLFLHPIVGQDHVVHEKLVLEGDPTILLWVVPITHAEYQFILKRSLDEFTQLLDKKQHPFVLDETRRSYVRAKP